VTVPESWFHEELHDVPLSVEPLIGSRLWNLAWADDEPVLSPAGVGAGTWPAREPFVASCRATPGFAGGASRPSSHPAPQFNCRCGIYASTSFEALRANGADLPLVSVVGHVALWGRVVEHEHGWRATFAYPQRLRLVCAICLSRARGRGDPVGAVGICRGEGEVMSIVAFCADHAFSPGAPGPARHHPAADLSVALLDRYAVDPLPREAAAPLFDGRAPHPKAGPRHRPKLAQVRATPPLTKADLRRIFPWHIRALDAGITIGKGLVVVLFWGAIAFFELRSCVVSVP
jgi:hypothetical protein